MEKFSIPEYVSKPRQFDSAMIKELRVKNKLTQAELAGVLGIRQQTVSEWEVGKFSPGKTACRVFEMFTKGMRPVLDDI